MKIMVTGANGFIGKSLVQYLSERNYDVISLVRNLGGSEDFEHSNIQLIDSFDADSIKNIDFSDVSCIVHLAARAHILSLDEEDSLLQFRKVNTKATLCLASAAADAGVKRFIFLSSIGVNGTSNVRPFTIQSPPDPKEDYAISKYEAETGLMALSKSKGIEVVIIRPPLVYGPDAPGNFGRLAKLANSFLPLPLASIDNKRSFVSIGNLVDLIERCIEHPDAVNQVFLVSDDEDISTSQLLKMLREAAGKRPLLVPMPITILKFLGRLLNKESVVNRLCDSLQVDISFTKNTLMWKPPQSVSEGIKSCFYTINGRR